MFGIGPIWSLMIGPRIWSSKMRRRMRHSVIATNLVLAIVIGAIFWFVGPGAWLLVQMPTAILAGTVGVWMFYVQHQFEDVYWESSERWSYADAALRGSSYLKLPKVLQFFTGNIGLHHVHHLSAKVPNYNLQRAHDENPIFHDVPVLTVRDGLRAIRLKVIDPKSGRLLTWNEVRARYLRPQHCRCQRTIAYPRSESASSRCVEEDVDDLGVELGSPALADQRHGFARRQRRPVAAVAEQGVEDVGDRRDPAPRAESPRRPGPPGSRCRRSARDG